LLGGTRAIAPLAWPIPSSRELSLIRDAITFSGTPVKGTIAAPPLLGADTRDVLARIGYDDTKLEKLKAQTVI
jgi:crotonobetainyl-CoA:carnitine CoA-transferase CaiB-like acyl-CoA transferase